MSFNGKFFCLLFTLSSTTFSQIPYSSAEIQLIQEHLVHNILSLQNSFVKSDNGLSIPSLPGAVLASPSKQDETFSQDYQFHWVRDASLTMNQAADWYENAEGNQKLQLRDDLINYIHFERKAQSQQSKPNEMTLGQPKYNIDGTIWEGKWARPQNDGPALRAITMMHILAIFNREHNTRYQSDLLAAIETDLDYVVKVWHQPTYDLWEEMLDRDHFFTKLVQRKALLQGSNLFSELHDTKRANQYKQAAQAISNSLEQHWNKQRGYITETVNQQFYKGGGLNTSIILAALYGDQHNHSIDWTVADPRVMSTVYYLRNSFAMLYRININHSNEPPMLGRYPNDIYDGNKFEYGNPWILTTHALADFYYQLANYYLRTGSIEIESENILFFQQMNLRFIQKPINITNKNKDQFECVINALLNEGDKILLNAKQYATCEQSSDCYHFSEQIDRTTGAAVSAKDLTWNYVTLLSALKSRENYTKFRVIT